MAHQVETMAYANETPWHGLGTQVSDCLTPEEILKEAKLDWSISKTPIFAETPDKKKLEVDKRFMLLRDNHDLNIVTAEGVELPRYMSLGVCGPAYTPFQNEDVFRFFDKFTKAGQMKMETAGSLRDGQYVWALAKLNNDFELEGEDLIQSYLLMANPHIWGKAATAMLTPIRVVCHNTITFALDAANKQNAFRMPHMNEFQSYEKEAEKALAISNHQMKNFREASELLSKTRMKTDAMKEYLARVFMPGEFTQTIANVSNENVAENLELSRNAEMAEKAIMLSPGSRTKSAVGTFWGGFNGVTYIVDHQIGHNQNSRLEQAWFGDRANLKRRAFETAIEMAKAA